MTISFNDTLTTPDYTQLRRKRWQGDQYLSFCDNVVALSATMTSTYPPVTGTTIASLPYTLVSGSIANLDEGMVVIVSPTSDPRHPLAIRLRMRLDGVANVVADGTYLYVTEYSDIIGLGSSIFVYYAYDVIDALSRPDTSNPGVITQLEDYNQPFETMAPVIVGLPSACVDLVDVTGFYTPDAFDISDSYASQSGATVTDYLFSVTPTGSGTATVIAGDPATANVTYKFTAGEYWLKVVITDSEGVTWYRHTLIKAHDPATYPPSTEFEGAEITKSIQQGPAGRVKFFGQVSSLLNGTMAVVWVDEQYSDVDFSNSAGSLFGNIDLVGWIETEENQFVTDPVYSGYADVTFEIQGIGIRLSRIEGQLLAITNNASPTLWDQITDLTPWRAILHFLQRHTQALHFADFQSDDYTTTYAFPTIVTNAGRALDNVTGSQGIAEEYNAQLEFACDGRIQLVRRAPFVTNYSSELTRVAIWTNADFVGRFGYKFSHYLQYGYLNADGAAWDGVSAAPIDYQSRAPGLAQSSGTDQGNLNNQILAATNNAGVAIAELNQRSGTQYAMLNNTHEVTLNHRSGYHWLEPSDNQLYDLDLGTDLNIRGIDLQGLFLWTVKSVTVTHDNKTASREVSAVYKPVMIGFPGTYVPIIPSGSVLPTLPGLPPFPAFPFELSPFPDSGLLPDQVPPAALLPPPSKVARFDGSELLACDPTSAWWLTNIYLKHPTAQDITPSDLVSYLCKSIATSPFFNNQTVPAYLLASDGTNSAVWRGDNAAKPVPTWKKGADATGIYTLLKATSVFQSLMAYKPSDASTITTLDLTATNGGFVNIVDGTQTPTTDGTWALGQGWNATAAVVSGGNHVNGVDITLALGAPVTISSASMTYTIAKGTFSSGGIFNGINFLLGGVFVVGMTVDSSTDLGGTHTLTIPTGSYTIDSIQLAIRSAYYSGGGSNGSGVVTKVTYTIGGGSSQVALSVDDGATWNSPISVGTSFNTIGAFDIQRAGPVSYAGCLGKLRKATTLGGAYSDWYAPASGNPICCFIPRNRRNSTTLNASVSDPDVIVATTTGKLYWVNGTTVTPTDISPAGVTAFDNAACITADYGHHIAVIGSVSGTYHLFTSTNGGTSWTDRGAVTSPQFLHNRRNDTTSSASGSNKGQLYMGQDGVIDFSSFWASGAGTDGPGPDADMWPRVLPSTDINSIDSVY